MNAAIQRAVASETGSLQPCQNAHWQVLAHHWQDVNCLVLVGYKYTGLCNRHRQTELSDKNEGCHRDVVTVQASLRLTTGNTMTGDRSHIDNVIRVPSASLRHAVMAHSSLLGPPQSTLASASVLRLPE